MSNLETATLPLSDVFRMVPGTTLELSGRPTRHAEADALGKEQGLSQMADAVARIADAQAMLYADRRWSVLLILQAMDAGGKDGTIKHVLSGINPQGLAVTSFKAPHAEELAHDFLWRIARALPQRGMIGVFNRSHYEEVVTARVNPAVIEAQRLPEDSLRRPGFWDDRLADIRNYESYLTRQGTRIVKIFLHVGEAEQRKRLLDRLDDPTKLWKFDPADLEARARWSDYMRFYGAAIAATSTAEAPWHVVPADQKWFARLAVAEILRKTLDDLGLTDPRPGPAVAEQAADARRRLG